MSRPRKVTHEAARLLFGNGIITLKRYGDNPAGRQWAICCHGYGASNLTWQPLAAGTWNVAAPLAESGMFVLGSDDGGASTWTGPAAHTALDDLYTYATGTLGLASTCGLFGWSMGGGLALDWYRRNTSKVRAVYLHAPMSDLDYFHSDATYTAEIDAAFGGNYAANSVGHKIIAEATSYRSLGIPVSIFHGDADPTVPYTKSTALIAAVNDPAFSLTILPGLGHYLGGAISASKTLELLAA